MEFLSPKTKAHLEKLEGENAVLKEQVATLGTSTASKTPVVWIVLTLVFAALSVVIYFFGPQLSKDEIAQIQTEMWTAEGAEFRDFSPGDELLYSVQIGAFKNIDFKDVARGFIEASTVQNDSLTALVVGNYTSLPDAQNMLSVLVSLGMENAFIVAHKDGKNVGLLSNKTTN